MLQTAKQLADAVIPNEYGIDSGQKLNIGSKICSALLGKLLVDLSSMKKESFETAPMRVSSLSLFTGMIPLSSPSCRFETLSAL